MPEPRVTVAATWLRRLAAELPDILSSLNWLVEVKIELSWWRFDDGTDDANSARCVFSSYEIGSMIVRLKVRCSE